MASRFEPGFKTTYHFAPPLLARRDAGGRPAKIALGAWFGAVLWMLAKVRWLRGRALDPFRHSAERRMERELLKNFEADVETILDVLDATNHPTCVALAKLSAGIKGFGPVKETAARAALAERERHLAALLAQDVAPADDGDASGPRQTETA